MNPLILRCVITAGLALCAASVASAESTGIVINEIMYHPPADREDLQYIELYNPGKEACDLADWRFSKGVKFSFPEGTKLAPNGFVVVCRNRAAFVKQYAANVPVAGEFTGQLSHNGERLELSDANDKAVDSIKYGDSAPWPAAADGHSSSLERICPTAPGDDPANWSASNLPELITPSGTPGRVNDSFSANLPPEVSDVRLEPASPLPDEPVTVTANVADDDGVKGVDLVFLAITSQKASEAKSLPMKRISGDAKNGRYETTIPAQPEGCLIRYRFRATDEAGTKRLSPMANELRESWSYSTYTNTNKSAVPLGIILQSSEAKRAPSRYNTQSVPKPSRGRDAFIYMPPGDAPVQTFDFVQVPPRRGGYKVHFLDDQTLRGMTTINIIFEDSPRWVLTEPLSYEVYRMAGVPAELTEHMRVSLNGRWLGYYLVVEQPNKSFLARNKRDTDGNLYKLLWYQNGPVGKHEKKTNVTGNHDDVLAAIKGLSATNPEAQWTFIKENFNVDEFVNYYAVNMCIQNWDGFFNNYFIYHDIGDTGRWEIYPWDEDKTWGDYDGASSRYDWYQLPLTYGMTGSQRPAAFGGPTRGDSFSGWWRAPGYFSGPLLANPKFRERFLARLREICTTIFTKEKMFPIIDAMEARLEPEVAERAKFGHEDSAGAVAQFKSHMQSLRNQVVHRRQFILDELNKLKR